MASQLVEQGPRPRTAARSLPASAPVTICVYKITDLAGDVWGAQEGKPVALWQIQFDHPAKPSVSFDVVNSFNDYLRVMRRDDEALPANLVELQSQAMVRLVVSDGDDKESVGYTQWRPAFYVAGSTSGEVNPVTNFFYLFDQFLVFKRKQMAREEGLQIQVHPHIDVADLSTIEDDLESEHYTFNAPSKTLPLGVFDCQPCVGKKIVTMHIQPQSETHLSVLFEGATWPYRSRMDAHGVTGGYFKEEGKDDGSSESKGTYYRFLKDVDVSEEVGATRVKDAIGDAVFKHLAMRVVIDGEAEADSDVSAFIDTLREISCLHFK